MAATHRRWACHCCESRAGEPGVIAKVLLEEIESTLASLARAMAVPSSGDWGAAWLQACVITLCTNPGILAGPCLNTPAPPPWIRRSASSVTRSHQCELCGVNGDRSGRATAKTAERRFESKTACPVQKQRTPRGLPRGVQALAMTYFPSEKYHRRQRLNCCVRDGNRCFPLPIFTNKPANSHSCERASSQSPLGLANRRWRLS